MHRVDTTGRGHILMKVKLDPIVTLFWNPNHLLLYEIDSHKTRK